MAKRKIKNNFLMVGSVIGSSCLQLPRKESLDRIDLPRVISRKGYLEE
jgi:hypothetical protein